MSHDFALVHKKCASPVILTYNNAFEFATFPPEESVPPKKINQCQLEISRRKKKIKTHWEDSN